MRYKKINLYCLPYAGSSSIIYEKWVDYLSPSIELRPIELAGRGSRIDEPFYDDIMEAVEDVYQKILSDTANYPFAIFGHSMGGIIAYLLAKRFHMDGDTRIKHIFVSGRRPPHKIILDRDKIHLMDDYDFIKKLFDLGGTPKELLQYPEFKTIFMPMIRNDFRLSENYFLLEVDAPVNIDITCYFGENDELTNDRIDEWFGYTSEKYSSRYYMGGHFFINKRENYLDVIRDINQCLQRKL